MRPPRHRDAALQNTLPNAGGHAKTCISSPQPQDCRHQLPHPDEPWSRRKSTDWKIGAGSPRKVVAILSTVRLLKHKRPRRAPWPARASESRPQRLTDLGTTLVIPIKGDANGAASGEVYSGEKGLVKLECATDPLRATGLAIDPSSEMLRPYGKDRRIHRRIARIRLGGTEPHAKGSRE
jgi:hypothetical protein